MQVIEGAGRTYWAATDGSSAYYMGQIVTVIKASAANCNGTAVPLAVPAGAFDNTNMQIPIGIVGGFNVRYPSYDSTTGLQKQTGVVTQANQLAVEQCCNEGMYVKGDVQLLVQITEILPHTVIRTPIFNTTYGVAPTVLTATTAMTDGAVTAITTNACDFGTPVAQMATIYCRTGVNAGIYRVTKDTSATQPGVTTAFPYNGGIGDTFVRVPFKQGNSTVYIAGPGLFFDCSKSPVAAGTTLFNVICYRVNLQFPNLEYADFRFGFDHFCYARA